MTNYNHSTHRNDKVQKNRITDNRPLSLREHDDNEQMSYLNQWNIDHPHADYTGYILLILIGIIAAFSITAYIRHKSQPPPIVQAVHSICPVCHFPKIVKFKTLNQYKAGLKVRPVDLAELER